MYNKRIIKGQYVIFEPPEEDLENEKESAEEIAKRIIEDAEKRANEIIENANQKAESIINDAHLAYAEEVEKGRKEGQQKAQEETNALIEQYSTELNKMLEEFNNSLNLEIYNARILMFNILKSLVHKFLEIEIFSTPKWIENALNKILEYYIEMDFIKIHISSNILRNHPELIKKLEKVEKVEIIEDITLPDFSISVHTNMGKVVIDKNELIKTVSKIIEEELNENS